MIGRASQRSIPPHGCRPRWPHSGCHLPWFGVRKSLSPEQRVKAADAFEAESGFLSAGKKLFDTAHPAYRKVTAIRSQAIGYWRSVSLPFPEPGVRMISRSEIMPVSQRLVRLSIDLREAVRELDAHFAAIQAAARQQLGDLYLASDYPATLCGLFGMSWEFPATEPPEYLRRLAPELYLAESERVRARFEEAVKLAEHAFADELARLTEHLAERLSGESDGRPKVFRDSVVENLREFLGRFRSLSLASSTELEELVARTQDVIGGIAPQDLRESGSVRERVAAGMTRVRESLDGLLVDRPRRAILRRPR